MSFARVALYTANPTTTRGVSVKLSASKEKIVYTNGKTVFIRDIANSALGLSYSGHLQNATVARVSPTGYYCASADTSGTVRVWDTVGEDQSLKGEFKVISGRINDLEWDGESKRIIAVGDGKEKFGHAFMFDSGSSTGEIIGHSKVINAVAIRHQRPFRAATAGDDNLIVFHQGNNATILRTTPSEQTIKTHTKFVQDIRYAPSGDQFASVGSDGKIFLYDGKLGETLGEFSEGHTGTIYTLSWSPDSKAISTSSADTTVKLWDVETRKATTTYTLGTGLEHQQVGNVWSSPDTIVSLSFSGALNVFDMRSGEKPVKVLHGPQKAVTVAIPAPTGSETFLAGTADGRVFSYDSTGAATPLTGQGHTNLVSGLTSTPDGRVFSAGYDDQVREVEGSSFTASAFSTGSQPKTLATTSDNTVFVVGVDTVEAVRNNQKVTDLRPGASPTAIAATGSLVAIGFGDQKVRLFNWDGKTLQEAGLLEANKGVLTVLAFSPDGLKLAAGDSSGKIILYDVRKREVITSRWSFHSARINTLSWTADSLHCASGALDTHIYVWSVQKPLKNIAIKSAVPGGVNAVFWVSHANQEGRLAGTGADAAVKVWRVTFHG
ncbi:WD40 repeat-like protein [Multifurca ochricompacta]|uniref:WD40 repeat-like protein n=1 Tax=Multifurca ochricompacta TaxID=376703 RepID=A0AAD4M378_9AGAM|nr:WD40 repeat-like protein [Multifurca ochricompacta]